MVQVQFLSGKIAGDRWVARRFPVRIGRASDNDLILVESGIWDRHCELRLERDQGFVLAVSDGAIVTVNQTPVQSARLRNGDALTLGAAQLRFWLADPVLRTYRAREWFVWSLLALLCCGQVWLIYRLLL